MSVLDGDQKELLRGQLSLDTCCQVAGLGRYRSCFARQSRGWDGSFRIVDQQVPSFSDLKLPANLQQLTEYNQGLVLIAGPSGCGKTTTMAAMIELINQNRDDHIITMEDPIEYVFQPQKSHISQRQVGAHTSSFSAALRAALREDPDVIMIGELRDRETATLAISAAETGHLVFASLHTTGAAQTVSRILDFFPADQQGQIRSMISESIRGIICQRLIPRLDGNGRALALEVLFNNVAIGNLIREDRMFQLPTMMQINRNKGMCQLEDSLQLLVDEGVISGEEAWFESANKTPFKQFAPAMIAATAEGENG
jgi:twitching motility protein PilT